MTERRIGWAPASRKLGNVVSQQRDRPPGVTMAGMKAPNTPLLDRLLDPVGDTLTPEVARKLVDLRFDRKVQTQIDRLARKANAGELSEAERRDYETYVDTIDFIALLQAKAQAVLRRPAKA